MTNQFLWPFEHHSSHPGQFDEHLVRQLIKTITVFEDSCTVAFKSGVTVDVEE